MTSRIRRRLLHLTQDTGQTMAEYSILVAVIALVVVVVLPQLAAPITGFFTSAAALIGN